MKRFLQEPRNAAQPVKDLNKSCIKNYQKQLTAWQDLLKYEAPTILGIFCPEMFTSMLFKLNSKLYSRQERRFKCIALCIFS